MGERKQALSRWAGPVTLLHRTGRVKVKTNIAVARRKEECSFLKKRTKKRLLLGARLG
jgi:hypothetical protein